MDGKSKKEIRAKAQLDARARLTALANSRNEAGARIRCIVMNGSAEFEILRIAEELKAGMIILGRQDRSPLSRLIFGSVTADIIDAANCPVLVINNGNHSSN